LVDGTYVGTATASRDTANGTADLGILIGATGLHRQGLGTEAWSLVRDWLFKIGVRKITAGTMSVNSPMLRIFEKTGMKVEGIRRREFLWNGREVDLVLAAAFNDDWVTRDNSNA
jgi:RimJ/RimL family protein N-acetyltransferase